MLTAMHLPRLRFKRRALPFVLLAALAGLAGVLATGRAADDKKDAPARPALTVTTARPETARLPLRLNANGNVAAWQEALIGSESNGLRLQEVLVNVGDTVKAGQVLARGLVGFDSDDLPDLLGKSTPDLPQELRREAVHRDDLILL